LNEGLELISQLSLLLKKHEDTLRSMIWSGVFSPWIGWAVFDLGTGKSFGWKEATPHLATL